MTARVLKLVYSLRYHLLGNWSLYRWVVTLSLAVIAGILLRNWITGFGRAGLGSWALLILLFLALLSLTWLRRWAHRRLYVLFEAQSGAARPLGRPLDPTEKILIHATGQYEVAGKSHFFANLLAYWRTFATREHAVMAIVHRSRFLWLGQVPEEDLGMWYIFFRPEHMEEVVPGQITFGVERCLALQVRYVRPPEPGSMRRQQPLRQTVYLIFDNEEGRRSIWADLLADA